MILPNVCRPDDVVVVGARRTPLGAFQGALKDIPAPRLASAVFRHLLHDAGVQGDQVDTVLAGCVLTAGLGQAPARQAALDAGISPSARTITISKVCGSGLQALMTGADMIRAGTARVVVAGGMESMSRAPYLLPQMRRGVRFGHGRVLDHMMLDGLEDAASGQSMGLLAEQTAAEYGFSRAGQDAFARESCTRAQNAVQQGTFTAEIVPVEGKEGPVTQDEPPSRIVLEKIPALKPAFRPDGTITAASASGLCDGAAGVLMMSAEEAGKRGLKPLARLVAHAAVGQEPARFATAPVAAVRHLAQRAGWTLDQVDLFEINEAFAVVPMAVMKDLGISHDRINLWGGACALGHPIGASGARIVVTLLHGLHRTQTRRGTASLCIGGGEAVAAAFERVEG